MSLGCWQGNPFVTQLLKEYSTYIFVFGQKAEFPEE